MLGINNQFDLLLSNKKKNRKRTEQHQLWKYAIKEGKFEKKFNKNGI